MLTRLSVAILVLMAALPACVAEGTPDAPPPPTLPLEERPVLAVMPFEDGAVRGDFGWYWGGRRWRAGVGIADMITSELLELVDRDGTYRLVERPRLYEVLAEQDLGSSGRVDPRTAAEVGRLLGADLLVMGSVVRFDIEEDRIHLPYEFGFGAERCRATVMLDGRLVEVQSGEVLAAARGDASASRYGVSIYRGPLAGFDMTSRYFQESALGRASEKAVAEFADGVAGRMADLLCGIPPQPTTGLVVYVEDDMVMINLGRRDGVLIGDAFVVKRERQRVTDPDTGELLTVIYDDIGRFTVLDVQEKVSSGTVRLAEGAPGPPQVRDIVIPIAQA